MERQRDQSRRGKRRGGSYLCSPPMFLARNRRNVDRIFSYPRGEIALCCAIRPRPERTVRGSWVSRVGNRPSGTSNTTTKEGRTKEAWLVCSCFVERKEKGIEKGKGKKEKEKEREEKRRKDCFGGRLKQCGRSDNAGVTGLRIQRPETRLCGWTLTRSSNK